MPRDMFGWSRENLTGESFLVLYPSAEDTNAWARMVPFLNAKGHYADASSLARFMMAVARAARGLSGR